VPDEEINLVVDVFTLTSRTRSISHASFLTIREGWLLLSGLRIEGKDSPEVDQVQEANLGYVALQQEAADSNDVGVGILLLP
jgi:hypothetical protein